MPAHSPRTFREALQSLRILHYAMWCEGDYHNTLGRFDQYMFSYLKADLDAGRETEDSAFELLEAFFLACNRDSDMYPGMQQGDNGQSMVLGGMLPDGTEGFNLLSKWCLKASAELRLIDPKINLRVNKDTPLEVYELGTQLTKLGLGFPQYENDDVAIPGLEALGYDTEDARNYVMAACWEFIIPGRGMDIVNIGALPFANIVDRVIREHLREARSIDELKAVIHDEIFADVRRTLDERKNLYVIPSPTCRCSSTAAWKIKGTSPWAASTTTGACTAPASLPRRTCWRRWIRRSSTAIRPRTSCSPPWRTTSRATTR